MKEIIETNYELAKEVMKPFASIEDFMENVDATVACAKDEIAKWKSFNKLFDSQIAILIERGVPGNIVRWYENEKERVLKHAMETTFGKGNVLFLPIIPLEYRTFFDLMAMVRNADGKAGYTDGNFSIIDMAETVPSRYIFDVSDGMVPLGGSEKNAKEIFAKQNRFPLTAVETIALCVHTDVLSRIGYLSALGSCLSGNENQHLSISAEKNFGRRPKLTWGYVQNWPPHFTLGVPSRDCWPRMKM